MPSGSDFISNGSKVDIKQAVIFDEFFAKNLQKITACIITPV
ncbi:hypothetical protein X874_2790 [Mannheimia varigena USDA-ARS-USMARC-1312]|nr:hypothetical protein X874_2790 [Mannheimia varigena USDA-ARS-USMARC-1312]